RSRRRNSRNAGQGDGEQRTRRPQPGPKVVVPRRHHRDRRKTRDWGSVMEARVAMALFLMTLQGVAVGFLIGSFVAGREVNSPIAVMVARIGIWAGIGSYHYVIRKCDEEMRG